MRYNPIPSELFIRNRKRLVNELKPNSLALFNANDTMPTNADGTMVFRQNNDLFYLTGVDQEESILVLCPNFPDEKWREVLFLKETSEMIAIWEGHKLTKEEARKQTGIETVLWLSEFPRVFRHMMTMGGVENVYLNTNEHYRADITVQTRDARFIDWCKSVYPLHQYQRIAPIVSALRSIKSSEEIALMQKACDITDKAFRRVLKFVKPGVKEYEIEAEFIHEFIKSGSAGFAYTPIIASGGNSCVLHYIENDQTCNSGDILLLDVGASYANYNADMTRVIPVNGKFTPRQKEVYNSVLRVKNAATKMLRPGVIYFEYHKEIQKIIESELIGLNLLKKEEVEKQNPDKPLFQKYFMHGTSHMLGLDVHDVGNMHAKVSVGQVWTIEPGIYIREEKLGIRLENNVLIGEKENVDLMKNIPIEAEEIEELMNS
ncbi:MAG: aminopeptidase P family protein [Bacteroidota bacterium]|jgi:Xaa-Pro aminopeptidase|nr:aminopeptidase P family protein [Cytophagales bacterium]